MEYGVEVPALSICRVPLLPSKVAVLVDVPPNSSVAPLPISRLPVPWISPVIVAELPAATSMIPELQTVPPLIVALSRSSVALAATVTLPSSMVVLVTLAVL